MRQLLLALVLAACTCLQLCACAPVVSQHRQLFGVHLKAKARQVSTFVAHPISTIGKATRAQRPTPLARRHHLASRVRTKSQSRAAVAGTDARAPALPPPAAHAHCTILRLDTSVQRCGSFFSRRQQEADAERQAARGQRATGRPERHQAGAAERRAQWDRCRVAWQRHGPERHAHAGPEVRHRLRGARNCTLRCTLRCMPPGEQGVGGR